MFLRECDNCKMTEERVFTDTWTGKNFCATCLWETDNISRIHLSPYSDPGDENIHEVFPDAFDEFETDQINERKARVR